MASVINPLGNSFPNDYAAELVANARALVAPGKGILAADESTGTIGKRVRLLCGSISIPFFVCRRPPESARPLASPHPTVYGPFYDF
jgi:hypothetical protein